MDKFITAIQWLFGVIVFGLYGGIEFAQSWGDVLFNVVNIGAFYWDLFATKSQTIMAI